MVLENEPINGGDLKSEYISCEVCWELKQLLGLVVELTRERSWRVRILPALG